jgi:hypothetical protein
MMHRQRANTIFARITPMPTTYRSSRGRNSCGAKQSYPSQVAHLFRYWIRSREFRRIAALCCWILSARFTILPHALGFLERGSHDTASLLFLRPKNSRPSLEKRRGPRCNLQKRGRKRDSGGVARGQIIRTVGRLIHSANLRRRNFSRSRPVSSCPCVATRFGYSPFPWGLAIPW